ncbi:MAG: RDD family protein [Ginsengibacter sp.]
MSNTLQTAEPKKRNKILVYCLASAEEQDECEAIKKYLSPVIRNSPIPIEIDSDFEIPPGEDTEKYKERLYNADIVLAFISADFINDEETYQRTKKVITRYNNNETIMLPILVRNCMWKSTPFVNLPLLPKNFQPLNNKQFWNSEDDALTAVVSDIYESINSFSYQETLQQPSAAELKDGAAMKIDNPSKGIESETLLEKKVQQPLHIEDIQRTTKILQEQEKPTIPLDINWRKKYYKDVVWKRGVAFILDNLLTMIPVFFIAFVIASVIAFGGEPQQQPDIAAEPEWGKVSFLLIFTLSCYFIVCAAMESSGWRGTFGKRIMKLQITDREGRPISFFRALWRNIMRFVTGYSYLLIVPAVIQYFTFKSTRQLFHDQLSYTVIGEKLTG